MKRALKRGATRARNPGVAYGTALDRLNKAERELRRAFHRWEKYRAELARCERRLDLAMQIEAEAEAPDSVKTPAP